MAVEIRERIAGREIDVGVRCSDFELWHERPWRTRVVCHGCRSRKRRRPRLRRQRKYVPPRRNVSSCRGKARGAAFLRGAPLLLRAKRQSQKRAHYKCCTPIAHLFPPMLYQSIPVWFTRPLADRSLRLAGSVGRIAAAELVASSSPGNRISPHPGPDPRRNLKKQQYSAQSGYSTICFRCNYFLASRAASISFDLLSTADCQLSHPALHFLTYELDHHARQSLDGAAANHRRCASRVGRPPRHYRPRPGLHARDSAQPTTGMWFRRERSRRHSSHAHPPGPRRRYRRAGARESPPRGVRPQEWRAAPG